MTTTLLFSTVEKAALSFTGNTLGLLGTFNPSAATTNYTADGIGTFITNDTLLRSPGGYPFGTTQAYLSNNSTAILTNLSSSQILYAGLFWGGTYVTGNQDFSTNIEDSVILTTPTSTFFILPNTNLTTTYSGGGLIQVYRNYQDITSIVQNSGTGSYTLQSVVGALGGAYSSAPNGIESCHLGWCIASVYKNRTLPYRNITLWAAFTSVTISNIDVPITNFATPDKGILHARLAISVGSGDSYIGGDSLYFGRNASTLSQLSGPNNLNTNFFASQINYSDSEYLNVGLLNTTGSFGTFNQPIGSKSLNGRQGFDVTNIDVSSTLTYNQTSALIRLTTTGDYYYPYSLGLQIDVNAPNLTPIVKTVNKAYADLNDILIYTITFNNKGSTSSNNTILIDTISSGTTFIDNSLFINNINYPGVTPYLPGIQLNTIPIGASITITYKVLVNTITSTTIITNYCGLGYNFISAISLPTVTGFDASNLVSTTISFASLNINKELDLPYAKIGDIITYTIPITNTGSTTTYSVFFQDTIPNDTAFINNSLSINGILSPLNPNLGFTIPNINYNNSTTISFKVTVISLPVNNPITNTAFVSYKYIVDPLIPTINSNESISNEVLTTINDVDFSNIKKYVSKTFITTNHTLTYTIVIPNNGNIPGINTFFLDTLATSLEFIPSSVFINYINYPLYNPNLGFSLDTLLPNSITTITFDAKVIN